MAALIPAAIGAAGALFATGDSKVGQNTFRASDYKDTNGYNPNAQYLGGQKGFAGAEAGRLGGMATAADNRGGIYADYRQANDARSNALGDRGLSYDARGSQSDALGMMRSAALGQQPSVAQMQMQQGQSRALADQMSMAASQPTGPGSALAARTAMNNAANIQSATAANTAQLRAQEMDQARNAYLGGSLGMGGQDLSRMGADLGMYGQDSSNANSQAGFGLASRAQNDARAMAYEQMRQQMMAQEAARAMGNNSLLGGSHQGADLINSGINRENAGNEKDFFKFGMGSISGGMQAGVAGAGGGGGSGGGGGGGGGYPGGGPPDFGY